MPHRTDRFEHATSFTCDYAGMSETVHGAIESEVKELLGSDRSAFSLKRWFSLMGPIVVYGYDKDAKYAGERVFEYQKAVDILREHSPAIYDRVKEGARNE